jgi:dTDP-4-amino-4,6-dideoxygalactose transaminase
VAQLRAKRIEPTPEGVSRSVPITRPRLPTAAAVLPYLERIDETRWYSNFGPLVEELEARLAERFHHRTHVVTTVNATQALTLTLKAMDLPEGAICAMPAWTFVATAHAACEAGLTPWFLDVDPATWMLDPDVVRDALARAPAPVSVVIPVIPFGLPCDLAAWAAFREATGVAVLIDGAAAFDTLTEADPPAVLSLHATKVLGLGEGGCLATSDEALARHVRSLSSFGFAGARESLFPATNAKISEYAAAVGLAALDGWPLDRLRWMRAAQTLRMALSPLAEVRFQPGWGSSWITSVCTVSLPEGTAAQVEAGLRLRGVDTRRWWGDGCHRSTAFAECPRDVLTVTDRLAASTIGLPFSIDLTAAEAERVAASVAGALSAS